VLLRVFAAWWREKRCHSTRSTGLQLIVPPGSLLPRGRGRSLVVAGKVETFYQGDRQRLFGALGVMAAAQGHV